MIDLAALMQRSSAYAGIGSRETPIDVLELMKRIAAYLGERRFSLRSGGSDGADTAFEQGSLGHRQCIFLPWSGFNGRLHGISCAKLFTYERASKIAACMHPNWERLSVGAKGLHVRNVHQVLGTYLDEPAAFVLCWTPDGATEKTSDRTGGTGQAIRIAVAYKVPVYNLARGDHRAAWETLVGVNRDENVEPVQLRFGRWENAKSIDLYRRDKP